MKVKIDMDGCYIVYFVSKSHGDVVDVDQETIDRWEDVWSAFDEMQTEMREYTKNVQARKKPT